MVVCESVPTSVSGNARSRSSDFPNLDYAREILEVHLVNDAGVRWDDTQVVKGALSPAQKGIPLAVALELQLRVPSHRRRRAELIDLHGVVDDEFGGEQRIDACGVATEHMHRVAHRREIDNGRHPGEILKENAARPEGDLVLRLLGGLPPGNGLDLVRVIEAEGGGTDHVLEKDSQGVGQAADTARPDRLHRRDQHRPVTDDKRDEIICHGSSSASTSAPAVGASPAGWRRPTP